MKFKEFEQEILKNGIETAKDLHNYGNFFVKYYFEKAHMWIAVVVVKNNEVIGCSILSNTGRVNFAETINIAPIKSFSAIMAKHLASLQCDNMPPLIDIRSFAVEIYATKAEINLLNELKIIEMPKGRSRLKGVTPTTRFALPDFKLVEQVAVKRATVLCPNCRGDYLYFRGKVNNLVAVSCKQCGISYYKKL